MSANLIGCCLFIFVIPAKAGIHKKGKTPVSKQPAVYILASKGEGVIGQALK
jgi:hypothetical protein